MTGEITAQNMLDVDTMLPAYRWHGRRRRRWFWPVIIVSTVLLIVAKYIASKKNGSIDWFAVALIPIVFGIYIALYVALRKFILRWNISRALKRMPAYGRAFHWTSREDGMNHQLGETRSFTECSLIYESVGTPDGGLVYPQKNLFYWFPKTGFTSDAEYHRFLELLKAKTKHSTVG